MSFIPFLYLIPAGLGALLLILSSGEKLPGDGEETKGIRGLFSRSGLYIYKKLPYFRRKNSSQITTDLGVLEPRISPDSAKLLYFADKIGMAVMLVFAGSILACLISFSSRQEHVVDEEDHIGRHTYGGGSRNETLTMTDDDSGLESEIEISITERQYTREQADALFTEASSILPSAILGKNSSLDEVRSDLDLTDSLDGYPFDIAWKIGNYSLIHSDGKIQMENIPPEGVATTITAQYSYLDYGWEQDIMICLYPQEYTEEELWRQRIDEILSQADMATVNEDYIALPGAIDGHSYTWAGKIKDDAPLLLLMTIIAAAAVYIMKDKDLDKRVRDRETEMISDYPQFVSKLVLYLGAGMTVRNVFAKLSADYVKNRADGKDPRFLYEEIFRAVNELDSGVSELTAYEHFSIRCRSQQYTRLCTLLSQNLRKGNSGLLPLLHEESKKAMQERMDRARKSGEEAGTKLLLPMMLMLVIVMVIIMLPAFLSF